MCAEFRFGQRSILSAKLEAAHGQHARECGISNHAERQRRVVLGGHCPESCVVSRGLADTQSAASQEATEAARKAKLGDGNIWMPYDGL